MVENKALTHAACMRREGCVAQAIACALTVSSVRPNGGEALGIQPWWPCWRGWCDLCQDHTQCRACKNESCGEGHGTPEPSLSEIDYTLR